MKTSPLSIYKYKLYLPDLGIKCYIEPCQTPGYTQSSLLKGQFQSHSADTDKDLNNLLLQEEFQSCTLPVAMRSLQEIKAPFEDAIISPVRQAGLVLLQEPEQFVMPCFAKTLWRQRLDTGQCNIKSLLFLIFIFEN